MRAPYWCAKGSALIATNACANNPNAISIPDLVAQTNRYATSGDIDPTSYLRNDRVFIFTGNQDSVVVPGIATKVQEYYQTYVTGANIRLTTINAEHTYPTLNYGNACSYKGSPYIGNCNYHGAYEMLNHIYPGITRPSGTVPLNGDFYIFDQSEFFYISNPALSSMDSQGYIYVPYGCMLNQNPIFTIDDIISPHWLNLMGHEPGAGCRLHIAFHGCGQGRHAIGDVFARNAGYNAVGEVNNIIILYPQAIAAVGLGNPLGCWDWWGYTINGYATKGANQPLAVYRMIERLS